MWLGHGPWALSVEVESQVTAGGPEVGCGPHMDTYPGLGMPCLLVGAGGPLAGLKGGSGVSSGTGSASPPLPPCAIPMGQGAQCSGGKEQTSRGSGLRVATCFQPACPSAVFSSGQGLLTVGSWQPEAQGEQGSEEKLPPQHTTISLHFFPGWGWGGGKQVASDPGPFQTLGVKSRPPQPWAPCAPSPGLG